MQYNRARWYDPQTGRWLSQDPIGFAAGDANLYRYVGNSPTNATDPSGLVDRRVISLNELEQLKELFPMLQDETEEQYLKNMNVVVWDPMRQPIIRQSAIECHRPSDVMLNRALSEIDNFRKMDRIIKLSHRNNMPYSLKGTWKVSVHANGAWRVIGHAWISYENVETGEVHTAGAYAAGSGGWSGTVVTVPGAQFDHPAVIKRLEGAKGKYASRSVVITDPTLYFRSGFGGAWPGSIGFDDKAGNNCATYARDVWYEYTGEFFFFNQQGPVDNPYELELDIRNANKNGQPKSVNTPRPWR